MPSVTSCTLQRVQPQTTVDEKNRGHYSLKYDVITNGVVGHKALANGAVSSSPHPLPSWGATYSYQGDTDAYAFAQTFSIESVEQSQLKYVITVNYSPIDAEGGGEDQFEPNPTERPAIVWADKETFTRIIDKDKDNKAILNKCKRPYLSDIEQEDSHGVIVVEFNAATLAEVLNYQRFLRRATNSVDWTFLGITFPPRTVIARDVAAGVPITENGFMYYRMSIRFVLAEEGEKWDVSMQEQGLQYFVKHVNGQQQFNADKSPRLYPPAGEVEPVNLDENGFKLAKDQPEVFTKWRAYREVNFNQLPISG